MPGEEKGDMAQHNPTPSSFSRWMLTIVAVLVAGGVAAMINIASEVKVIQAEMRSLKEAVERSQGSFEKTLSDHEIRMRRLERLANGRPPWSEGDFR